MHLAAISRDLHPRAVPEPLGLHLLEGVLAQLRALLLARLKLLALDGVRLPHGQVLDALDPDQLELVVVVHVLVA